MRFNYKYIIILSALIFSACGKKDDGAALRLNAARQLYAEKQYELAKQEIDSLKTLYPKSYKEIREGLAFLDTIRRGENTQIITECDSLISEFDPQVEKFKSEFSLQRDKRYQDTGYFIPKESLSGGVISGTTLRSGIGEDGELYIESVFVGGKQKHNKIKVSAQDGTFAESAAVNDDGLNYRFSNMGKEYEVIRFSGSNDNGIAKFIFSNAQKPLTATLIGQGKYSYQLPSSIKSAISKSYQLSSMMLQLDSLKTAKEKAEFHIYYLDNKKEKKDEPTAE